MFPLIFEQVSYAPHRQQRLINALQLRIAQAGTLAILGPNGAGKSLLLRLAHQLIKPTSGRVFWQNAPGGNATGQNSTAQRAAFKQQSMVFQQAIMLKRSVYANLHYALKLKPLPDNKSTSGMLPEIINDALASVGLANYAARDANSLSLGEQQKLAICRALITQPKVLFLDEPTASLDPTATYQIEAILRQVAATDTKLIIATHDLAQAKRIADTVLLLHHGAVIEYTNVDDFFNRPQTTLAAQFIAGELLWT